MASRKLCISNKPQKQVVATAVEPLPPVGHLIHHTNTNYEATALSTTLPNYILQSLHNFGHITSANYTAFTHKRS